MILPNLVKGPIIVLLAHILHPATLNVRSLFGVSPHASPSPFLNFYSKTKFTSQTKTTIHVFMFICLFLNSNLYYSVKSFKREFYDLLWYFLKLCGLLWCFLARRIIFDSISLIMMNIKYELVSLTHGACIQIVCKIR